METTTTSGIQTKAELPAPSAKLSVAWHPFAQQLALVLDGLQEDSYLILAKKDSNIFVQFVGLGSFGVRMETTSNYYRFPKDQLANSMIESLCRLGWNLPTHTDETPKVERNPDGSTNFYRDFSLPFNSAELAELTVKTFTQVLEISHPGDLEYQSYDASGSAIPVPQLGIKLEIQSDPSVFLPTYLLATIKEVTGIESLEYDADGDIGGICFGDVVVYVRLVENRPYVRFHSVLMTGAPSTPALFQVLNELNRNNGYTHVIFGDGVVLAVSEVLVVPYNASQIGLWLSNFAQVAEEMYGELRAELEGAALSDEHLHNGNLH